MRPLIVLLLLLAAQTWSLSVLPRSYDGYSVYKVHIAGQKQHRVLEQLLEQHDKYNLWHRSVDEFHIMVHPKAQKGFREIMLEANIVLELMIPNVQVLIDGHRMQLTDK